MYQCIEPIHAVAYTPIHDVYFASHCLRASNRDTAIHCDTAIHIQRYTAIQCTSGVSPPRQVSTVSAATCLYQGLELAGNSLGIGTNVED